MTDEEIKSVKDKALKDINDAHLELSRIQQICEHADVHKIPRSDSGYSEKTMYWYECECKVCGKFWSTYSKFK